MPAVVQSDEKIKDFTRTKSDEQYSTAVNPHWVRLLKLLQMDVRYERCVGTELFTADGRRILDFLSGIAFTISATIILRSFSRLRTNWTGADRRCYKATLPELAGELAERLCALAGGQVRKAFFCIAPWSEYMEIHWGNAASFM